MAEMLLAKDHDVIEAVSLKLSNPVRPSLRRAEWMPRHRRHRDHE